MHHHPKKLSRKTRDHIALCYSALGEAHPQTPQGASFYLCRRWRNSTMSPYFPAFGTPLASELKRAELFFAHFKSRLPYESPGPYLNLLNVDPRNQSLRVMTLALELNWKPYKYFSTINTWSKPQPISLPKGYYFSCGRYFERVIYRDFLLTMRSNFKSSIKFMRELNLMMQGIESNIRTVIIHSGSGRVAGAGLVATKNGHSFLFCGSICKRDRGKRLWPALVAIRQMISAEQGAQFWCTTTSNSRITGKGEHSFPMAVLAKDLSPKKTSSSIAPVR